MTSSEQSVQTKILLQKKDQCFNNQNQEAYASFMDTNKTFTWKAKCSLVFHFSNAVFSRQQRDRNFTIL